MITKFLVNISPSIIIFGFISESSNKKTNILINLKLRVITIYKLEISFCSFKRIIIFFSVSNPSLYHIPPNTGILYCLALNGTVGAMKKEKRYKI